METTSGAMQECLRTIPMFAHVTAIRERTNSATASTVCNDIKLRHRRIHFQLREETYRADRESMISRYVEGDNYLKYSSPRLPRPQLRAAEAFARPEANLETPLDELLWRICGMTEGLEALRRAFIMNCQSFEISQRKYWGFGSPSTSDHADTRYLGIRPRLCESFATDTTVSTAPGWSNRSSVGAGFEEAQSCQV